jgi:hypothetical protein
MLTKEEADRAQEWISAITYKPRSIIRLSHDIMYDVNILMVEQRVPSSLDDYSDPTSFHPLVTIAQWAYVTDLELRNKNLLYNLIRGLISQLDDHERDEWFKVDGYPIYWPHSDISYQEILEKHNRKMNNDSAVN